MTTQANLMNTVTPKTIIKNDNEISMLLER